MSLPPEVISGRFAEVAVVCDALFFNFKIDYGNPFSLADIGESPPSSANPSTGTGEIALYFS